MKTVNPRRAAELIAPLSPRTARSKGESSLVSDRT
jgi:hypothetical protein